LRWKYISLVFKEVIIVAHSLISSCRGFREGKCPHKEVMERAYLIPQLLAPDTLQDYKNICLHCIQSHQNRREDPRVSVSFFVSCKHPDRIELRGAAYNLSVGGVAIRTNYLIGARELLTLEFLEPTTFKPVSLEGQVAWRQFHGHTPSEEDTLFTAGIEFLGLADPTRALISKSIQTLSD
jgi:hypothetical protein